MATPLGTTFSTDEQVVAQGDITYMGKMVESLVVEFDQAKYKEFLSSGSMSPKARVYRKVSSGTCSRVRSEILSDATGKKDVVANHIMRNARVNVSQETRVVNVADVQPVHPLPQRQVTGGYHQPIRRNRNAEWQQRQRACQLQAGTTVCPTEVGREVQARVPSEPCQKCEVRVWKPKRKVHQIRVLEAPLPKRHEQQREVRAPHPRHETRASTFIRGSQKACVSQASLPRCDNRQRESRVSSQQRRKTRVSEPQRESCVHFTGRELRVSEPCVSALRSKDNSHKLKSPR